MQSSSFNIFSLRNRYIPALLFIALLATAYYVNDINLMSSVKNDAKIINMSGKQRMFSQRIVLLAKNYLDNPSASNLETLSEQIVTMKTNHTFLKKHVASQKILTIYENGVLDKKLNAYFDKAYELIDTKDTNILNILTDMSQEVLILLDEVVLAYELADKEKIEAIEKKEQYIYLVILVVLMAEAIFIFYPASKKIEKNTQELEEAIKEKTKELQKSIDIISDYVIYSRTDLKGKITYASNEFSNVSGYSNDELVGAPHNIVRHPDVPKEAFQEMWNTIQSGKSWQGEVKNRKKDGGFYWVDAHISPEYNKKGEMIGYAAIRHNITLQKEIEEINKELENKISKEVKRSRKKDIQLHEQAKMLQMSEMIGNIAHQWRQPLSAISAASSGLKLKKEMGLLSDEEYYETLDTITRNTKDLSKTIDTFSGFINYKKHKTQFVLQDKMQDAIEIIDKSLTGNKIALVKKFDKENIEIFNYASLLSQAVLNIITNAKEIHVKRQTKDPLIELVVTTDNERAQVIIKDNAGGIEEDKIGKIFDPYFTTKHQSIGTGMGLHNSYNIVVNDLNGELYVQNGNIGAEFFIELPLK